MLASGQQWELQVICQNNAAGVCEEAQLAAFECYFWSFVNYVCVFLHNDAREILHSLLQLILSLIDSFNFHIGINFLFVFFL